MMQKALESMDPCIKIYMDTASNLKYADNIVLASGTSNSLQELTDYVLNSK